MSITLSVGATSVVLPSDLYWSDELAWHPVGQSVTRSVTGALIVQTQAAIGGRPVTLAPPVELASWMPRAALLQLQAWANVPGQVMTLLLHGVSRDVIWRHQDGEVISARPVMPQEGVAPDDAYTATLKFMEV
jgi:hypothetical protein